MATVDPDDIARRLIEEVDFESEDREVVPYSAMSTTRLIDAFDDIKNKLLDRGELLDPKTPTGIDFHGIYHGILLELKRRGVM